MYGADRLEVREDIALITFYNLPNNSALLAQVFGSYAREGVDIDMVSQAFSSAVTVNVALTCPRSFMVKVLDISNALRSKYPQLHPMVSSSNCKLTLSGPDICGTQGVFARATNALAEVPVELQLVTSGGSEISMLVTENQALAAAEALRRAFGLDDKAR